MLFFKTIWSRFFTPRTIKVLFGPGVVGRATAEVFGIKDFVDWNGKLFTGSVGSVHDADEIWICVPTPQSADGRCDTSEVERVIKFCSAQTKTARYIIRSTVTPGTGKKLATKYGVEVISFPEFLSENSALEDTYKPWFCVIGGDLESEALNNFINDYWWYFRDKLFFPWNNTSAEMAKYSVNSLFATLVVFANELYDASKKAGAEYNYLREVLTAIPWPQQNHLTVFHKGYRGYGGKCLPKDTLALATTFNIELLQNVHRINKRIQRNNPLLQPRVHNRKGIKIHIVPKLPKA